MGEHYFLRRDEFLGFLDGIESKYDVYTLANQDGSLTYVRYARSGPDVVVGQARAVDPLKSFLFPARELVSVGFDPGFGSLQRRPRCVVGAKSCDLHALKVLDHVFKGNGGPDDPFYCEAREQTLLISSDCTRVLETCFCSVFGLAPQCDDTADLNLSELDSGVILTVLSSRGKAVVASALANPSTASPAQLQERDQRRGNTHQQAREMVERAGVPSEQELDGAVDAQYEDPAWAEMAGECVECGACNTICPTCHCFLLFDRIEDEALLRFKTWDSCLLRDFARVAGGHNPRPRLWTRLRNRFVKKFSYFPKVSGMNACTGCGRCIEACPAQIDIRNVLKRIVSHANSTQPVSPH
jgi:ferredoxin